MKNVLFLVYTTKENIHTCFSKHLIIFCNVIFSDWKKSIFINSDFFDIVGLLDEHCVISGFMGASNMLNIGTTADSANTFGVFGGNTCDEVHEIVGYTSSSASVPTA